MLRLLFILSTTGRENDSLPLSLSLNPRERELLNVIAWLASISERQREKEIETVLIKGENEIERRRE